MVKEGIIGSSPAVRVSVDSEGQEQGRELLVTARESNTSVAIAEVGSTGFGGLEPLVLATLDNETAFFSQCSDEQIETIVAELDDGTLPTGGAMTVAEHSPETVALPSAGRPFDVGTRSVLSGCGWAVPTHLADYRAEEEYITTDIDTEEALTCLREIALRGRGRGDVAADTLVADHWETVAAADGNPVVIVNANDADPHAAMDQLLLESSPFAVLDPAFAAAVALDATDVVVYMSEAETVACRRTQEAANALADDLDIDVSVQVIT